MTDLPDPRFGNHESSFQNTIRTLQRHFEYDPEQPLWMIAQLAVAAASLVFVAYVFVANLH